MTRQRFSVLGDSISTLKGSVPDDWRIHYEGEVHIPGVTRPADTWWGKVVDHYDGELVANSSYSGSVVEGFGFPAGCCPERIAALTGADGTLPDTVLVFMGINDYGWGGGRQQVMGGSVSASAKPEDLGGQENVLGVVGPEALERFERAYAQTLRDIRRMVPEAEIWCVNLFPGTVPGCPWPNFMYRIRGIEMDDYNDAIARAASQADARVVDVRSLGLCLSSVDGVHPDALGMEQLATAVIAWMEREENSLPTHPIFSGAPRAERDCYRDNCDGCSFADIDRARWSLYCSKNDPR